MIDTSDYWKAHIGDQENTFKTRLTISFSDYNIDNDISASVSDPARESFNDNLSDSIEEQSFDYFTWVDNAWGRHLMSTDETSYEHGAISSRIANVDRRFIEATGKFAGYGFAGYTPSCGHVLRPTFSLSFTQRLVTSLLAVFNKRTGRYAEDFQIIVYDVNNDVIHTEVVTGNTGTRWSKQLSTPLEDCVKVTLVIDKWSVAEGKAEILELFTSVQEILDDDSVISISAVEEIEGIGESNNSSNTMEFQVVNIDGRYDDDNDASPLQNRITKNRRVKAEVGMVGDNDDLGWQNYYAIGTGYTSDWTVDNDELIAGANTYDLVSLMDQYEYTQNQFIEGDSIGEQFTYTDFSSWSKSGLDGDSNGLRPAKYGHAASCSQGASFFGTSFAGETFATGCSYIGYASQSFTYNYVPGTSVYIELTNIEAMPEGDYSGFEYSIDGGVTWLESDNDVFSYVPENQVTIQTVSIRVCITTQTRYVKNISNLPTSTVTQVQADERSYVSLYSLAVKVLEDFNDETQLINRKYRIDAELAEQEIPHAFLTPATHRAILSQICQAGAARFYVDRDEYINLVMIDSVYDQVAFFDKTNSFSLMKHSNPSGLTNRVTVLSNPLIKATVNEEIVKSRYSLADGESKDFTVKFKIEPSELLLADIDFETPESGLTLTNIEIYSWGVNFTVNANTGTDETGYVIANGKPYRVEGQERISLDNSESIRQFGVIEKVIDNSLIQSYAQAFALATPIIASYAEHKRDSTADVVPDISLEANDGVTFDSNQYRIKSQTMTIENGLTQIIKGEK